MRKAVEKIIKSANSHNYPDDIINILKREDLSVDILKNIDYYYYNNRDYYTSKEICDEINKVLSFPFNGNSRDYKEKIENCLPSNRKDTLLGESIS